MIADRHLHTRYSEDSAQEPEGCVLQAISLGMPSLTFTDHYDIDFPNGGFLFDVEGYFRELGALKEKYADRIDVKIGIELGLKPDNNHKIQALLARYPFEYKIGSIHLIGDLDPYERHLFDMPDEEFYRKYFEIGLASLRACGGFDTFGHLDYVVRYGYQKDAEYSYRKYADVIDEILKELIRRDIALEINTAGLRKGLKYAHPYPDVLKRYRELGGRRLAIGSDAHIASDIGAGFPEALACVEALGFTQEDFC